MKLYQYQREQAVRIAIEHEGKLVDPILADLRENQLSPRIRAVLAGMANLILSDEETLTELREVVSLAQEREAGVLSPDLLDLCAPLTPPIILCGGSNYADHNKEKAPSPLKDKEPEFFLKSPTTVAASGEVIHLNRNVIRKLDYEVELGVVIGRAASGVSVEDAMSHVFGYTIGNDLTARERQVRREPDGFVWYELGTSKNFDQSTPLGPCIVTADEIEDVQNLRLTTRVNGEVRQNGSTASMKHSVAELVSHFSGILTLQPGTLILTGTPGGTAWASDPELGGNSYIRDDIVRATKYLELGDEVVCQIEGIGELVNTIG